MIAPGLIGWPFHGLSPWAGAGVGITTGPALGGPTLGWTGSVGKLELPTTGGGAGMAPNGFTGAGGAKEGLFWFSVIGAGEGDPDGGEVGISVGGGGGGGG